MPTGNEIQPVISAMTALGEAWRGSWMDFDGRTLRSQLDELARIFDKASNGADTRGDVAAFYALNNICPRCRSWIEFCDCESGAGVS